MRVVSMAGQFVARTLIVATVVLVPFVTFAQKAQPRDLREDLRLIETFDLIQDEIFQATFTKNGKPFILGRNRTGLWEYSLGAGKKIFIPCNGDKIIGSDYGGIGDFFSISCPDFSIEVWDTQRAKKLIRFQVQKVKASETPQPYTSSDGTRVLITFAGIGEYAELWNAVTGTKIAKLTSEYARCFSCNRAVYYANGFSPDSKIAVVSFGAMTFLWNAETGKLLNRLIDKNVDFYGHADLTHNGVVSQLLFSRDSKILVTGSYDGAITSWDTRTGELLIRYGREKGRIESLALSPDGQILAVGSRNNDFKLWDLRAGRLLWASPDIKKEVTRLSFSPEGKKIMSGTSNRFSIWDTATGKLLAQMPITSEWRTDLSPDWRSLIMPEKTGKTLGLYEYRPN